MAEQFERSGAGGVGVIGVFHSEQEAREVAESAISLGADPQRVMVGAERDHYRALRSEQQDEVEQSWISPQFGVVYPKESAKSLTAGTVVAALIGALVLLPFAALPIGDLGLGWKLLIMAAVGVTLGVTVGTIVGPAIGVKRPNEGLAAERGVTVRVEPANEAIEKMMIEHDPIRVDRFDGEDLEVVATEELGQGRGMVDEVKRNLSNPKMESDPGYAPPTGQEQRAQHDSAAPAEGPSGEDRVQG